MNGQMTRIICHMTGKIRIAADAVNYEICSVMSSVKYWNAMRNAVRFRFFHRQEIAPEIFGGPFP
jgi:hypothetical protein